MNDVVGEMFGIAEDETFYGLYLTEWIKDPESEAAIRYGMIGKRVKHVSVSIRAYVFVQIADEGMEQLQNYVGLTAKNFKNIWKRFIKDYQKKIGGEAPKWAYFMFDSLGGDEAVKMLTLAMTGEDHGQTQEG